MEGVSSLGVVIGSPLMALIGTVFLPSAVWDSETGRYYGYFNKKALQILLFVTLLAGFITIQQGNPGPDVAADVGFYLFIAIVVSRLTVEFSHRHKHKVWLHHQYHKLTDHDDPREAPPSAARAGCGASARPPSGVKQH